MSGVGEETLQWVARQNARTRDLLENHENYQQDVDEIQSCSMTRIRNTRKTTWSAQECTSTILSRQATILVAYYDVALCKIWLAK